MEGPSVRVAIGRMRALVASNVLARRAHQLVIGQVVAVHIADEALTANGRVDLLELRPIARLGYQDYASVDALFQMKKRTPEDGA